MQHVFTVIWLYCIGNFVLSIFFQNRIWGHNPLVESLSFRLSLQDNKKNIKKILCGFDICIFSIQHSFVLRHEDDYDQQLKLFMHFFGWKAQFLFPHSFLALSSKFKLTKIRYTNCLMSNSILKPKANVKYLTEAYCILNYSI